ncbi:unnamed protein product [Brassica rapa]|uniref:Uncharacterized protein n=1 Tax=Brassica campestris TaxID=3711 RepID=A0A8D9LWR5_BRACM|nr:unnamed protein product [Brassica rapa]
MFVESDEQLHLSKTHYVKHQLEIWNSSIFLDDLKVGSCSTTIENIVLSSPPHPFNPSSVNALISLFTLIFNAVLNLFSFTLKVASPQCVGGKITGIYSHGGAVKVEVTFMAEEDWVIVKLDPAQFEKVVADSVELLCPGLGKCDGG